MSAFSSNIEAQMRSCRIGVGEGVGEGVVVGSLCSRMVWNEGPFSLSPWRGPISGFLRHSKEGQRVRELEIPNLG